MKTKAGLKAAIEAQGVEVGDVPFRQYAKLIRNISTVPTLTRLKEDLDSGTAANKYPVGKEVIDIYDGYDSPWTIMHYGTATVAGGATKEGAYLVRLIAEPLAVFGLNQNYGSANWRTSKVRPYLNSTYLGKCTDEFRSIVSPIFVPYYGGSSTLQTILDTCWLLSATEVMGVGYNGQKEGFAFDLWKQRTGLVSPNNANNAGRIIHDRNGIPQAWWLRTAGNSTSTVDYIYDVNSSGGVATSSSNKSEGLVVACFIAKD